MALLGCDSFDHYLNNSDNRMSDKYIVTGGVQQLRLAGRYDDDGTDFSAALMNTAFGRVTYHYPLDGAGSFVFFAFDCCTTRGTGGAFAGNSDFVSIAGYDSVGGTWKEQIKVAVLADGHLEIWRSTGDNFTGTLLASTDPDTLEQDVWKRVTVKFGLSTGIWLYVDGVELVALPFQTLTVPASNVSSMGRVGFCWQSFGFEAIRLDNMVLWDSQTTGGALLYGLQGNLHVKANYVDAAVEPDTVGTWTPNTGTSLAAVVDERPLVDAGYHDRDVTYVSVSADAEIVYKFLRFFPSGDIMGVVLNIGAKASASVTLQSIVRGAVDAVFPVPKSLIASGEYFFSQFPYDVDPENSEQWQQSDFVDQRWRFGALVNFGTGTLRITQIVVEMVHDRANGATADYRIF